MADPQIPAFAGTEVIFDPHPGLRRGRLVAIVLLAVVVVVLLAMVAIPIKERK